jgi:hypothetical protein
MTIRTMAITPSSICLRGGWRVAGRVTAVIRVVCFLIIFYAGRSGQARVAYYISAFDVAAGVKRRG